MTEQLKSEKMVQLPLGGFDHLLPKPLNPKLTVIGMALVMREVLHIPWRKAEFVHDAERNTLSIETDPVKALILKRRLMPI